MAAATKLVAGRVADRRARRPLIAIAYGFAALGKALVAVAGVWPVVLAGGASTGSARASGARLETRC